MTTWENNTHRAELVRVFTRCWERLEDHLRNEPADYLDGSRGADGTMRLSLSRHDAGAVLLYFQPFRFETGNTDPEDGPPEEWGVSFPEGFSIALATWGTRRTTILNLAVFEDGRIESVGIGSPTGSYSVVWSYEHGSGSLSPQRAKVAERMFSDLVGTIGRLTNDDIDAAIEAAASDWKLAAELRKEAAR
jgi:hypothetical protein